MARRLTRALTGVTLLGVLGLAPSGASASGESPTPVLLTAAGSYGLDTLTAVSTGPAVVSSGHPYSRSFRLPDGVRQGQPQWYLIRLDATIRVPAGSRGSWNLSGDMNGYTGATIDIHTMPGLTRLETISLLGGRVTRREKSSKVDLRYANYAQVGGVRPGRTNLLTFRLAPIAGGLGAPTARLEGTSGLELTPVSPDEIGLGTRGHAIQVRPGHLVRVPYVIRRRGARPEAPVTVTAAAIGDLEPVGDTRRSYATIGHQVEGTFEFRARTAGEYSVLLRARTNYNQPGGQTSILVSASAPSGEGVPGWAWLAGVATAGCVLVSVVSARWVRRRRGVR